MMALVMAEHMEVKCGRAEVSQVDTMARQVAHVHSRHEAVQEDWSGPVVEELGRIELAQEAADSVEPCGMDMALVGMQILDNRSDMEHTVQVECWLGLMAKCQVDSQERILEGHEDMNKVAQREEQTSMAIHSLVLE